LKEDRALALDVFISTSPSSSHIIETINFDHDGKLEQEVVDILKTRKRQQISHHHQVARVFNGRERVDGARQAGTRTGTCTAGGGLMSEFNFCSFPLDHLYTI
jgi:hypothetical protein